jgi:hypothetical protein
VKSRELVEEGDDPPLDLVSDGPDGDERRARRIGEIPIEVADVPTILAGRLAPTTRAPD